MLTVMARECLNERREDTGLDKLVIDDLSFGRLVLVKNRCVTIRELTTNRAVLQTGKVRLPDCKHRYERRKRSISPHTHSNSNGG